MKCGQSGNNGIRLATLAALPLPISPRYPRRREHWKSIKKCVPGGQFRTFLAKKIYFFGAQKKWSSLEMQGNHNVIVQRNSVVLTGFSFLVEVFLTFFSYLESFLGIYLRIMRRERSKLGFSFS